MLLGRALRTRRLDVMFWMLLLLLLLFLCLLVLLVLQAWSKEIRARGRKWSAELPLLVQHC
jgi:hypothetical protein